MGAYIGPPMNFVRRAGDTMTGNLDFSAGFWVAGHAKIKTGTYVGNGVDNRNIDIGVNLSAKDNVWIIIKNSTGIEAMHRIEYSQGDFSMYFHVAIDQANLIQGLTATGFQVGSSDYVNQDTELIRYIVIYLEP